MLRNNGWFLNLDAPPRLLLLNHWLPTQFKLFVSFGCWVLSWNCRKKAREQHGLYRSVRFSSPSRIRNRIQAAFETARLSTSSCRETHYCYCSPKVCLNPTGGNRIHWEMVEKTAWFKNSADFLDWDAGKMHFCNYLFISYTFLLQNSGWFLLVSNSRKVATGLSRPGLFANMHKLYEYLEDHTS